MRVLWIALAGLAVAQGSESARSQPPVPAGQLVREVIYNELHDHQQHGFWRYWVRTNSKNGTRMEEQVETVEGPIARLTRSNGRALNAAEQHEEQARLEELLISPSEQARHVKEYDEDEARIGRILALLPDAFVYFYDGEENGCYHLRFRPNPGYSVRSIEARVFHAMSGELWVDARSTRLARLEGRIDENVDFGFGILGRLYEGGWFRLERVQVSANDWKTKSLEIHVNVRALLVKTFARETSEERGGFAPVPAGMSLAQGLALLDEAGGYAEAGELAAGNSSFVPFGR